MDILQTILIPAGTSLATTLVTHGSNGIVQTINDIWELVFGDFHHFVEKKRALHEKDLNDFKEKINKEIGNIPTENLQEPSFNIIAPALEASKYYIENEVIRGMFAKLIGSSMDSQKTNQVHSSYVEILKQLSPLDAQNLTILKTGEEPIIEYRLTHLDDSSYQTLFTNVFLSNSDNQDIDLNAISLSNISRLGLSIISYDEFLSDSSMYSTFKATKKYEELSKNVAMKKAAYDRYNSLPEERQPSSQLIESLKYHKLSIKEGIVRLTPLGKSFVNVCC
jgi:hypothetical protein